MARVAIVTDSVSVRLFFCFIIVWRLHLCGVQKKCMSRQGNLDSLSLTLCWCLRLSCFDSTSLPLFHTLDSGTRSTETLNWRHLPISPKNSLITAKDCWWGFEFSGWFRQGGDTRTVQALLCLCGFFAWSIKMFQRVQDLQVLTDSDSNAICTLLFCCVVFLLPEHSEHVLQIAFCRGKCPLASVLASEESWRELGTEQVPSVWKPYHHAPPPLQHWSDGCYSTPHTAEYKRGVINM